MYRIIVFFGRLGTSTVCGGGNPEKNYFGRHLLFFGVAERVLNYAAPLTSAHTAFQCLGAQTIELYFKYVHIREMLLEFSCPNCTSNKTQHLFFFTLECDRSPW